MKKIFLETSFSKIYMIVMIIITLLILGGYFSYAMFTVSKEKSNAISIVTGNLVYELLIDGEESNNLIVPAGTTKEFTVTLSNPNNRVARFNFYYLGTLPNGVSAGYKKGDEINIPPSSTGINLEASETSGSSNTYKIKVTNTSSNEITITLGVSVGLDYNDLTLSDNGHLFEEYAVPLADLLLIDNANNINKSDSEQYFITGADPNNYIWYSGKLWRAVSIDPSDNSIKIITEYNMSSIPYSTANNSKFSGSYMESWLKDTTIDSFIINLRDPEKYIKMDSKWNATTTTSTSKPSKTTLVESPVGLLNIYEYTMSYTGTNYSNGYLNNGLIWWSMTPYDGSYIWAIHSDGTTDRGNSTLTNGIRPVVNLKSTVKTVEGDGTEENPYRLEGDNDKNLEGVKLNTRYSGEYINFGIGENTLYRIVSKENGMGVKITSAEPLKENGNFKSIVFDSGNDSTYSTNNEIGEFLNGEYITNYVGGYYNNMIEETSIWYIQLVGDLSSYKLAKYVSSTSEELTDKTTNAKVGLLRMGELLADQNNARYNSGDGNTNFNFNYWLITPRNSYTLRNVNANGGSSYNSPSVSYGIRPALNLKENVIITGGDGTKNNPFQIKLS